MTDFATARYHMAECQIRPDRVRDERILAAVRSIARERFLPDALHCRAYADQEICLPADAGEVQRVMLAPRVLARLAEIARIRENHILLDVGCASGYSSAVLARSAQLVIALESDPPLAEQAEKTLLEEECDNVSVVVGAFAEGHAKQQPYDAIVLQGSVPAPPGGLLAQLAQGGRLVCVRAPQGTRRGRGGYFIREGEEFPWFDCFDAAASPLPGFARPPAFHFPI